MAAQDDLDELEAELEDYVDDEDEDDLPPVKRLWKKYKLFIIPLASLPVFGLVIWASTGDSTIADRKVVVIPELANKPGQAIKVKPEQPGGQTVEGKDKAVFNVVTKGENEGKIAIVAPPEEPKDPAQAAEGEGPIAMVPEGAEKTPKPGKDSADATVLPPPTPPENEGEVAAELPAPDAPAGDAKSANTKTAENILPAPPVEVPTADVKEDQPAKVAMEPEQPAKVAMEAEQPAKPAQQAEKKDVASGDNQMTVVIPKKSDDKEAQVAAVTPKPAAPKVTPPPSTGSGATTPMRTMSGVYRVQIASARSEGAAKTLWNKQVNKHPDLLGQLPLTVQQAVIQDRGTFYRVQGGAFNDRETADAVCRKLKARGQDCLVVRP
jgi:hypothetical protein